MASFCSVAAVARWRTLWIGVILLLGTVTACGGRSVTSPSGEDPAPGTFFVAPTGSDDNVGTIASPWLTLRHALSRLRAGNTLYLRGGTYTGDANTIDSQTGSVPSGTSWSNPVTIAGYRGELVTIRPPNNVSAIRLTTGAPAYLVFADFAIDMAESAVGADANGVFVDGGHHIRLERLDVANSTTFGIGLSANSEFNEVLSSKIHNTGYAGSDITNGHGLYVSGGNNVFEDNDVYDNQGYGMHLYNNAGPFTVRRNIIRKNRFWNNGLHGGAAYGMVVAWGPDNVIENNVLHSNPGGILVYSNSVRTVVQNNTVYANSPLQGIYILGASDTIVRNNVVYGNETDLVDEGVNSVLSNNRNSP
jgi:parallel beta-helix repeat protein